MCLLVWQPTVLYIMSVACTVLHVWAARLFKSECVTFILHRAPMLFSGGGGRFLIFFFFCGESNNSNHASVCADRRAGKQRCWCVCVCVCVRPRM